MLVHDARCWRSDRYPTFSSTNKKLTRAAPEIPLCVSVEELNVNGLITWYHLRTPTLRRNAKGPLHGEKTFNSRACSPRQVNAAPRVWRVA